MPRDIENGNFTRIHNEILDQMALGSFTIREYKCLIFLLRKTYGYQKKEDAISLNQWVDGTGIDKRHIGPVLNRMVERNIVNRTKGRGRGNTSVYGFNKYYEQWDSAEKVPVEVPINKVPVEVPFSEEKVPVEVPEKVPVEVPTKERKKVVAAPPPVHPWIEAFYRLWGRYVSSPYELESIHEWEGRVPMVAWEYALKESSNAGAKNWKYLTRILERVEQDGVSIPNGKPQNDADFVMEELL